MRIQDQLRQWSSSTLDTCHRSVGQAAAERIDTLENLLCATERAARELIDSELLTELEERVKEYT